MPVVKKVLPVASCRAVMMRGDRPPSHDWLAVCTKLKPAGQDST